MAATRTSKAATAAPLSSPQAVSIAVGLVALAMSTAAIGLVIAGGTYEALPGLADPGP